MRRVPIGATLLAVVLTVWFIPKTPYGEFPLLRCPPAGDDLLIGAEALFQERFVPDHVPRYQKLGDLLLGHRGNPCSPGPRPEPATEGMAPFMLLHLLTPPLIVVSGFDRFFIGPAPPVRGGGQADPIADLWRSDGRFALEAIALTVLWWWSIAKLVRRPGRRSTNTGERSA